ncbi:MAG TPA: ABC transporter permease [Vicinamibacteria bacterium]
MPEWKAEVRERLQGLRLKPERELELIEEIAAHLDDRYQECLAAGAAPEEARRAALGELREPDLLERGLMPLRQARAPEPVAPGAPRRRILGDLWQDVRYGLRTLRQRPGFTAAAVLTLALGIGANTAIFSLVNSVLLQRLPAREPERLVHLTFDGGGVFSYPDYVDLRDHQQAFEGLAAWGGITASLNSESQTEFVTGLIVTGNYFDVLGVYPALGRLLSTGDDVKPGAHPVVVLNHSFWRTRFGARADVVGRELLLNGQRFTVVGVAPEGFQGTQPGTPRSLYVPMMMQAVMRPPRAGYSGDMDPDLLRTRTNRWLTALGRLKPGVTPAQAAGSLDAVAQGFIPNRPASAPPLRLAALPVHVGDPGVRARLTATAQLLMAVVGAVLFLACANVANLLLSRAAARRREIAVRLALGASRWRLVRQLLTESLLLAGGGGAAGLLLAFWIMRAFAGAAPPPGALPIAVQAAIDGRVLAFTLALSLLAGLAFGLAPALAATRPALTGALKDESFVADERARRFNLKQALVVSQVGLSLALLVAAGLFVRSLQRVQAVSPGIDVDRLVSAQLPVNLLRYTRAQGREFYTRVVERMEALPGVESAAVARVAALGGGGRTTSLHLEGRAGNAQRFLSEGGIGADARAREQVNVNVVGPRYFHTLGVALRAGRDFDARDVENAPGVAVVNEAFWRLHYPDRERGAVPGQRLSLGNADGPWREIVGVVADAKQRSLTEDPLPTVYVPLAQNHESGVILYVRTSLEPAALLPTLRREVQALEPNLPLPDLRTLRETVAGSTYAARMGATLLGAFAALALFLAAIGVYGVTSFSTAQRTREIGVRMALGARRRDVGTLVLKHGLRLVALGVALGLLLAFGSARALERFLYGVSGTDPLTFALVPLLLAAVAFVACLVPARRATRLDPLDALRYR